MGLFNRSTPQERQLEQSCAQLLRGMGVPSHEVGRMAASILQKAREESKQSGTANLPVDFGDRLLAQETSDPSKREMLENKRKEGVTDADIRWWWNLPDVERRVMDAIEELNRGAMFRKYRGEGMSAEQAGAETRKYQPIYGDPSDTSVAGGEDRPLPYELMDRVNRYAAMRREALQAEISRSSTFNALVRAAIRAGDL